MAAVDGFGLDERAFGMHSEEFYGAIGRIICLGALIEHQLSTLRHTLQQVDQGLHAHEPVGQQIASAQRLSTKLSVGDGELVRGYLVRAKAALDNRNAVAHSTFPAQHSGRVYGYRAARKKEVCDGQFRVLDQSNIADLKEIIAELSGLSGEFNSVHNRCHFPHSAGPGPRHDE